MSLKLVGLCLVFIASGGAIASEFFKKSRTLTVVAAVVAVLSFLYLLRGIGDDLLGFSIGSGRETSSANKATNTELTQVPIRLTVVQSKDLTPHDGIRFVAGTHDLVLLSEEGQLYQWQFPGSGLVNFRGVKKFPPLSIISDDGKYVIDYLLSRPHPTIYDISLGRHYASPIELLGPGFDLEHPTLSRGAKYFAAVIAVKDDLYKKSNEHDDLYRRNTMIIDTKTGQNACSLSFNHHQFSTSIQFSSDGEHVISGFFDGKAEVFDSSCRLQGLEYWDSPIESVTLNDSGTFAALSLFIGIRIWQPGQRISGNTYSGGYKVMRFSPASQLFAAGSDDGTVSVVDSGTGSVLHSLRTSTSPVEDFRFSDDGLYTSVGHKNGEFEIIKFPEMNVIGSIFLFSDGEWVYIGRDRKFCASRSGAKYIRKIVKTTGAFWNGESIIPLTEADTEKLSINCANTL